MIALAYLAIGLLCSGLCFLYFVGADAEGDIPNDIEVEIILCCLFYGAFWPLGLAITTIYFFRKRFVSFAVKLYKFLEGKQ